MRRTKAIAPFPIVDGITIKLRTWICCLLPAVMLDIVQHTSLRIDSFKLVPSRCRRHGRTLQLSTSCVWTSSPVTMLPTARNAAATTLGDWCLSTVTLSHTAI